MSLSSTSEPRLFGKHSKRKTSRETLREEDQSLKSESNASVCQHPSGVEEEMLENSELIDGENEDSVPSRRLQRMKVQSRRTFKFRKTRKREHVIGITENIGEVEKEESQQTSVIPVKSSTFTSTAQTRKPASMTATVFRRARQGRKQPPSKSEIMIDDDSISSARTSSTVGYRDSFGDYDDGCFHLLEQYDDSSAVMRLLQSRRRLSREQGAAGAVEEARGALGDMGREALIQEDTATLVEGAAALDSGDEYDSDSTHIVSNYVIFEQNDEDTLI